MRVIRTLLLAGAAVALVCAQQFKFNLDQLAGKASETVDLSLTGSTLRFAARFLDDKDPDDAKVKKLIAGLEGIYIKSFEFKKEGAWSPADLEGVRSQLRAPEWSRIVGFKSAAEGETAEVWVRNEKEKVTGVAILGTSPKSFTVVNIAGAVDLESLAELGGNFGVPKLEKVPPRQR
ncbi:MAG: DUF4252 domain-containing protein [Acidobacteriia bacterium]|nr:DUF4252 domain-containing protein [Terriglobia bacterium]